MAFFDLGQPIDATKFGLASVQDFCSGGDLDQLPDIAADVIKKRYQWFENVQARPFEHDRLGWPTNFKPAHLSGDSYITPVASVLEAIVREACIFEKDKAIRLERFLKDYQIAATTILSPPPTTYAPPPVYQQPAAILTYGDLSLSLVSCRITKVLIKFK